MLKVYNIKDNWLWLYYICIRKLRNKLMILIKTKKNFFNAEMFYREKIIRIMGAL